MTTSSSWRPGVTEQLGFYVYVLTDPRTDGVFYVGKGTGERCFAHLAEARKTVVDTKGDYPKLATIRAIEAEGLAVKIDMLRHGLDETTAFAVESAAIDLLRLAGLTNRVVGHASTSLGRMTVADVNALYGAVPATFEPEHKLVLIRVAREFRSGITDAELYDATRRWWRIDRRRRTLGSTAAPDYALAVYRGVVRAAYRIESWEPAGPDEIAADARREGRWGFIGHHDPTAEARYLLADVTAWLPQAAQNPIRYINC